MSIETISTVSLRDGGRHARRLQEPIGFRCVVCGQRKFLGKDASMLVRLEVRGVGGLEEIVLCDACADVIVEVMRFGPRVLESAARWRRTTYVMRIAGVDEELVCAKCKGRNVSNVFVKFVDIREGEFGKDVREVRKIRVCGKCAMLYLSAVKESRVMRQGYFRDERVEGWDEVARC